MRTIYSLLACSLLMASCADTYQYIAPEVNDEPEPVAVPSYAEVLQLWEDRLWSADFVEPVEPEPTDVDDPDYDNFIETQGFKDGRTITIEWTGSEVHIDNTQADKGVEVTAEGGYVVVRNQESEEGADDARGKVTYRLRGTDGVGQLKVYSNKKFQLVLDNLYLTCPDGPAISIQEKKRCFVTLATGSVNTLRDAEQYASDVVPTAEDEKGCLFSEGQLIFSGNGSLRVHGFHQHGIASDEYVRIHPGCSIEIKAAKDGIHTKQQYHQTGSVVRSYALKDALQSDSLGVRLTGGYLYLFGERALTANGGGSLQVDAPAQICPIEFADQTGR